MQLSDFDYTLPPELIAQAPAARRDASRLLVVGRDSLCHLHFPDLGELLRAGDLLVLNDTRVIKARLMGEKDSGGRAEILIERIEATCVALCQVRVSKPLLVGRTVTVGPHALVVLGREGEFYRLRFPLAVLAVLEAEGEVPLPPYIERAAGTDDESRYQTVYGERPGAIAAPTAGLHFTDAMLDSLGMRGIDLAKVTLHVGAGTFQPVRTEDLNSHRMHFEQYEIGAPAADAIAACRARGGRVVAVGTTVVRTLEAAAREDGTVHAVAGETDLFITPGYRFRVVDALLTNFHLPKSTLLMLISAFGGLDRMRAAYATAIAARYRFFSYGDAMFLERMTDGARADV